MIFKKYPLLIAMVALTVILFFAAWNTGNFYILITACILAAFVVVGYCYPIWALDKIALVIEDFPGELDDRTPVAITINSFNKGWLARRELLLELKVSPLSQKSAYSMNIQLPVIKQGSNQIDLELGNIRRGRYLLSQETFFHTGFPFGLVERKRSVVARQDSMVVRPFCFPVNNAILDLGSIRNYAAIQTRQNAGNSREFFGIREYRYGDSVRHIDWKTTAKHNEVIVREFEEAAEKSFIIAVNCDQVFSPPDDTHDVFEKSIRIAASIATSLLRIQYPVGLYTNDVRLDPASDPDQEIRIMEILTDTENLNLWDYWSRLYEYLGNFSAPQTILLFANVSYGDSKDQDEKIRMLASLGHEIKLVLFVADGQGVQASDIDAWRIPIGSDAEGSFFE